MQKKILEKIWGTTLGMFIILSLCTIPFTNPSKSKILPMNLEVDSIMAPSKDTIYLLNKNHYFVQIEVPFQSSQIEEKVKECLDYLKEDSKNIPSELNGFIPNNTKIKEVILEGTNLKVDLTKDFFNTTKKEIVLTGFAYSLLEWEGIESLEITIEKEPLLQYPKRITKSIGINKEYEIDSSGNVQKVVLYYLDEDWNYTPVTKYISNEKESIEVIIEELKKEIGPLISLLNDHTQLLDYHEEENVMVLNFNSYLLDSNPTSQEYIAKTMAYSVIETYDINRVVLEVNGEIFQTISKP